MKGYALTIATHSLGIDSDAWQVVLGLVGVKREPLSIKRHGLRFGGDGWWFKRDA
jgi:hypothetical protein